VALQKVAGMASPPPDRARMISSTPCFSGVLQSCSLGPVTRPGRSSRKLVRDKLSAGESSLQNSREAVLCHLAKALNRLRRTFRPCGDLPQSYVSRGEASQAPPRALALVKDVPLRQTPQCSRRCSVPGVLGDSVSSRSNQAQQVRRPGRKPVCDKPESPGGDGLSLLCPS